MAEAIREVVATSILHDVADPRVRAVTVVRVEVTGDLRFATVFV
jgi:ribosome-binding factor A